MQTQNAIAVRDAGHDSCVAREQRACSGCAGDYEDPDDGREDIEELEEEDMDGSAS